MTKTYRLTAQGSGNTSVMINASAGAHSKPTWANISISNEISPSYVYGAYWAGGTNSSLTRINGSALFTDPIPAVNNGSGSSPFDTIAPWKDIARIEDENAGILVSIPKFYYKLSQDTDTGENGIKIQICDGTRSTYALSHGYHISPAHMNRGDGVGERDVVYIGAYSSASDYTSKTGSIPTTSGTQGDCRSGIHNLGSTIWQLDFATLMTLWLLYVVEYADFNSQKKIGYGCGSGSAIQNTGACDSMIYHTGTNVSSRTSYGHTRYRYIEDLWGNVYNWLEGLRTHSGNADRYIILNPSDFGSSSLGINVGVYGVSGNPKSLIVNNVTGAFPFFEGKSGGGVYNNDYEKSLCDTQNWQTDMKIIVAGGNTTQSFSYGILALMGWSSETTTGANYKIGCRLMKLP